MEKEKWVKFIHPDYEDGRYFISTYGNMKTKNKILSKTKLKGYLSFTTYKKDKTSWKKPVHWYMKHVFKQLNRFGDNFIDHKDMNKHNNLLSNLRISTKSQNQWNRGPNNKKNRYSKYKGVTFVTGGKRIKRWRASLSVNGICVFCKHFSTEIEAVLEYNKQAKIYHGEFAFINKI